MNSRRRFHIALVFVWALAHGMWMGAVWHSASAHGAVTFKNPGTCCGARGSDRLTNAPAAAPSCAVCALATVAPDQPPVLASFALPAPVIFTTAILFRETPRACVAELPPSRAPPCLL